MITSCNINKDVANPRGRAVKGEYGLVLLKHGDREFDSRSRYRRVSIFLCFVLSCVGRGLAMGQSPSKESYKNG
jgi:hypothetical protein